MIRVQHANVRAKTAKPFLRWVGGKQRLVPELLKHAPAAETISTYFEPFLGAGSLFWALKPARAVLSDANARLIDTYWHLKMHPRDLIRQLTYLLDDYYGAESPEPFYYALRGAFNAAQQRTETAGTTDNAARFIALNKLCFQGLWRVNGSGHFNVPYGKLKSPTICDAPLLRACSVALQGASLFACDFAAELWRCAPGDFVYFDPPYEGTFSDYTAGGFDQTAQRRLFAQAELLDCRGVRFMLSSPDCAFIRDLWEPRDGSVTSRWTLRELNVRRSVAANWKKRTPAAELLITNY